MQARSSAQYMERVNTRFVGFNVISFALTCQGVVKSFKLMVIEAKISHVFL